MHGPNGGTLNSMKRNQHIYDFTNRWISKSSIMLNNNVMAYANTSEYLSMNRLRYLCIRLRCKETMKKRAGYRIYKIGKLSVTLQRLWTANTKQNNDIQTSTETSIGIKLCRYARESNIKIIQRFQNTVIKRNIV